MKNKDTIIVANSSLGTHAEGNITYTAETAIAQRYVFGKINQRKVSPARRNERAVGLLTDTGQMGDPINVIILGSNIGTLKVRTSMAVAQGDLLTPDSNGLAANHKKLPAGTYHIAGIALTNADAGELVEFTPTLGLEKVIEAAPPPPPKSPTPPAAEPKK